MHWSIGDRPAFQADAATASRFVAAADAATAGAAAAAAAAASDGERSLSSSVSVY